MGFLYTLGPKYEIMYALYDYDDVYVHVYVPVCVHVCVPVIVMFMSEFMCLYTIYKSPTASSLPF